MPELTGRKMTTTCTYHCSRCRAHFHSLEAFDAHRQGDFNSNDLETGRQCVHPLDLLDADGRQRLSTLTRDGECRMYDDGSGTRIQRQVTIWTLRQTERCPTLGNQRRGAHSVHAKL